jgi:hypothetical protein
MSDNTRNFYGRSPGLVEERYMASVFGAFRAAVEEHLPVAVVNDWNLNEADLARYKVLILPNTACLDARQIEAVDRFVRDGGGLVASLDTSLFDEFGTPRDNFALAEVLGVDYRDIPDASEPSKGAIDENFAKSIGPDYWEKRKNVFDFRQDPGSFLNQGWMKTYVGDEPVTFKGAAVRVAARDGSSILGSLRVKSVAGAPTMPGAVTRSHGKVRVVYLASGFDSAYYLYPYQRLVLKHAIAWAASAPPPIAVEAPMCVHTTLMRQAGADGERLIVHLFSDLNTTAHHALPVDEVPLREEVVPIRDIRIRLAPNYRFRRVQLEPEGWDLEVEKTPEGTVVVVPRLDVHAMVVGELLNNPVAGVPGTR